MLNTTIHKTETNPVTRVIEKTITPDKVTDLYSEIRKEIIENVLLSMELKNSLLHVLVKILDDPTRVDNLCIYEVNINGEKFIKEFHIERELLIEKNYNDISNLVMESVKDVLANNVGKVLMQNLYELTHK